VTQKNQAYCGVASLTMVLNALGVSAPSTPEFEPFKTFTQDNLLNDETEKVLPKEVLAKIGMTLDQIGQLLTTFGVKADVHHTADTSLDEFRKLATEAVGTPNRYVIVNYLRRAIGQERGGHISPLAAYDADTDRFLVLDVSRYKYPPVWVEADDLYAAMNTPDSDNQNRTRGFVLVAAKD
jgi:Phytochelatin synthase